MIGLPKSLLRDFSLFFASTVLLLNLLGPVVAANPEPFTLALCARRNIEETVVRYQPLADYFKKFGLDMKIITYTSRQDLYQKYHAGKWDLARVSSMNHYLLSADEENYYWAVEPLARNYEQNIVSRSPEFVRKVRGDFFDTAIRHSQRMVPPQTAFSHYFALFGGLFSELFDPYD